MSEERERALGSVGSATKDVITPETREKSTSVAIGVVIIGLDPQRNGDSISDPLIWTLVELQRKSETEKSPGQVSIPAETRTLWENRKSNILGALAEFTDDTTLSIVANHLYEAESSYCDAAITLGQGNMIDLAVFVYDGPLNILFQPVYRKEVAPLGWTQISKLREQGGLRDGFKEVLELDQREGFIEQVLEDFYADRGKKRVIPEQLESIEDFSAQRDTSPDVLIARLPVKTH